jgi:hypothetical protein
MIPAIWIFTHPDGAKYYQVDWIKNLIALDIEPCVDALHWGDKKWRKDNFSKCPHRFYSEELRSFFTVQDEEDDDDDDKAYSPDIAIAFNEDQVVSEKEWFALFVWVTENFSNECSIIEKPSVIKVGCEDVIEKVKDEGYAFQTFITDQDIMFYQVKKPQVEIPYTTYTENFSERGHLDFFTSLFICESWGCSTDVNFLSEIWKFLGMTGKFNIEDLYCDRVARCIKGEAEPVVYRAFLDDVMQTVKDAKSGVGCGHKRKLESTGNQLKK